MKDKSSDTSLTEVRRVSLHTMSKVPSLTIEGADLKVELNEQSRMEPVIYTVGENQTDFHDFASSEVSSEVEQ